MKLPPVPSWSAPALRSPAVAQEAILLASAFYRLAGQTRAGGEIMARDASLVAQISAFALQSVAAGLVPMAAWVMAVESELERSKNGSTPTDELTALWTGSLKQSEPNLKPKPKPKPIPLQGCSKKQSSCWKGSEASKLIHLATPLEVLQSEQKGPLRKSHSQSLQSTGVSAAGADFLHANQEQTSKAPPAFRRLSSPQTNVRTPNIDALVSSVRPGSATEHANRLAIETRRQRRIARTQKDGSLAVLQAADIMLPGRSLDESERSGLTARGMRYVGGGSQVAASASLFGLESSTGSGADHAWRMRVSGGDRSDERYLARMAAAQTRAGGPASAAQAQASATVAALVAKSIS